MRQAVFTLLSSSSPLPHYPHLTLSTSTSLPLPSTSLLSCPLRRSHFSPPSLDNSSGPQPQNPSSSPLLYISSGIDPIFAFFLMEVSIMLKVAQNEEVSEDDSLVEVAESRVGGQNNVPGEVAIARAPSPSPSSTSTHRPLHGRVCSGCDYGRGCGCGCRC